MTGSGSARPRRTENAQTGDAGEARRRAEDEAMEQVRPDYGAREEQISEERKPMGPPLRDRPQEDVPQDVERRDDEPPVDPDEPN